MTRKVLMSPKDTEIIGTLEELSGRSGFHNPTQVAVGNFEFDYDGETEIYWNDQRTVMRENADGKRERVFLDENGAEFLESELRLAEVQP